MSTKDALIIGYACYKVGYSKGNHDGMDMQKLLSKAFEDDRTTND